MFNILSVTGIIGFILILISWLRIRRLASLLPEQPDWIAPLGATATLALVRAVLSTPNFMGLFDQTSSLIVFRILLCLIGIHVAMIILTAMRMVSETKWILQKYYIAIAIPSGFFVSTFGIEGTSLRRPNMINVDVWFGKLIPLGSLGVTVVLFGYMAILLRAALGPKNRQGARAIIIFGVSANLLMMIHDAFVIVGKTNNPYLSVPGMIILILCMTVAAEILINQQQRALSLAAAEASARAEAQRSFLSHFGDQVRKPMDEIRALQRALAKTSSGRIAELSMSLESASSMLHNLIRDLLDYDAIDAGTVAIDSAPFSAVGMVKELQQVASHLPQSPESVTGWQVHCPDKIQLIGDAGRIKQIALNLISNAKKFSDSGTIEVSVEVCPRAHRSRFEVVVSDRGIGIAEDRLETIFDSFTQSETGLARRYEGSGLGLSISRQLAELMGGTLTGELRQGGGMVFRFTVDLPTLLESAESIGDHGPIRILIIDDSSANRMVMKLMCEALGYIVSDASSGPAGLSLLGAEKHHVVLTDLLMTPWSGEETMTAIRRAESLGELAHGKNIPVIAISAEPPEADSAFFDQLEKPVTRQQVQTAVERAMCLSSPGDTGS